ncbi:ROK family protein [Nocardioides coralli]|uniref:ROK family protein n=1 Tax=Nocardioides coralli TaxID=2872154 RepID=UPI001CA3DD6A|nr:ROK family protein [Nocardioides coralli]QZY28589.1 ROK family protein [Nocardioides coralli]
MTTPLALAVDVGGTTIKGELVDRDGTVVAAERAPTPPGESAREAIGRLGDRLLGTAAGPVRGAGVVVPGIVDATHGVATYSANIGWRDLALAEPLATRWQLPVRLGHDVASAAVAEIRYGAGRGETDVCFVVIGTGVAAVVVAGGRVVTGHHGEIAEIGHLAVRPGHPCPCGGDGCLEAVASASAIARSYADRSGEQVAGAAEVVARLDVDPRAREVWQEAVEALADGLAVLATVVAPELIVVGGGLSVAGLRLVETLERELARRTRVVAPARVTVAQLGPRAGVVGAGMLAFEPWTTT